MHTCTIRLFLSQSFILIAITVLDSKKERDKENKSLPHHKVIGTRALLALKW